MAANERQNGHPAAYGAREASGEAASKPPAPDSLAKQLAELREHIAYYLSARADMANARLRSVVLRALFAAEAGLCISAAIVTAAVLLVVGVAEGLTVLCGDRPWAGKLAAGAMVLGAVWGATWFGKSSWERSARRKTTEKYARRRVKQWRRFGRDVRQRAGEDVPPDGTSRGQDDKS
ncbi:MAG TPA: hypothetical protein VND64_04690 [Pirellulales bacterium]|nr:hypothetical protein [Pirellulales bacterium]